MVLRFNLINVSVLVLALAYLIAWVDDYVEFKHQQRLANLNYSSSAWPTINWWNGNAATNQFSDEPSCDEVPETLKYGYYNQSCPQAENIIRYMIQRLYDVRPDFGHAFSRLAFHDCFVQGCDASILLDTANGIISEKNSPPNKNITIFDLIDEIKWELEEVCPKTVSCADIIVLVARESVHLAGGPFYPLPTGRRDGAVSFPQLATYELPGPQDEISKIIATFLDKGFRGREIASLLIAHCTGVIDWFYPNQLSNFDFGGNNSFGDTDSANYLESRRSMSNYTVKPSPSPSPSASPGKIYCHTTLEGKRGLFIDRRPKSGEDWYSHIAYAPNVGMFQQDFASAMTKMSSLQVLTRPMGQVRLDCRMVA